MNIKDCFNLGHITKASGFKGELVFYIDADEPSRYGRLDAVFIELNGQLVPFFIERMQLRGGNAVVKLEGVDTAERAAELVKAQLWLPLTALPKLKGKKFYFHEVIDFAVIDKQHGNIGIVEKVLDFPQQKILQVKNGDKEILIPVLEHIVKKVDRAAKTIEVEAPEGLIELYMGTEDDKADDGENEQD
jgi:16S rRNA processing protein RimM